MAAPPRIRKPKSPQVAGTTGEAVSPGDDLGDEKMLKGLHYKDSMFSGWSIEGCDIEKCHLDAVRLGGSSLNRVIISDTIIERCDLANSQCRSVSVIQSAVESSRLTGSAWTEGLFRDVCFLECRADMVQFRQAKLKSTVFKDSDLRQADFQWADLSHVRFSGCNLTAAQFAHASMSNVLIENCVLDGVSGVTGLKGATVQEHDLVSLAPSLAREIGILVPDHP